MVAGKAMAVTCPVAGYPISSITWEKEGRQLPFNDRQTVFRNGTLVITNLQRKEDAATYTCVARNDEGYSARSDLVVTVMGKWYRGTVILPYITHLLCWHSCFIRQTHLLQNFYMK